MNTLIINNLSKSYHKDQLALDNISLEINTGMFGLLGPNGAGKSTLMKTIAGLQKPDNGSIIYKGKDIISEPLFIKKQLGYLPQDFGVYPNITAMDLLNHLAILKGILHSGERKEQILSLLEMTNLADHRNKYVSTYSGGMKQRFGVAQALLGAPDIIIVDEPTAGLDPEERNRFNNLLSEIGENIIVILSTHLVEDVRNLCTQMAVIHAGKLLSKGNPEELINDMQGNIWKKQIDKNDLNKYKNDFKMLSTQLQSGKLNIRIFSNSDPGYGFRDTEASLEDVYFHTLQKTN